MTRKTTQLPKVNPGDYDRWCKEFDHGPLVRSVLAKFAESEAEAIRWSLFTAQFSSQQLTREQVRRIWPESEGKSPKLTTRINLTDYTIAYLTARLRDKKTRRVNEEVAELLNAAGVPGGKPNGVGWTAEAIKKRRERVRSHPWVSSWGPRYQLRRLFLSLAIAREPE